MPRRIFVFFLLFVTVLLLLPKTLPNGMAAQESYPYNVDNSTSIPTMAYDGVTYPDWENLSFSTIPPATGAGDFSVEDMAARAGWTSQDLIDSMGYDPSRSWDVGTPIENILKLGDFKTDSSLADWSLATVAQYAPINVNALRLSDFGLLKGETLEDVVEAVPYLNEYSLEQVTPFYDLISQHFGANKAASLASFKLGELSDNIKWGTLPIGELDLTQYSLAELPNIEHAKFGGFINWSGSFISEVPGLSQVPLSSFMLGIVQGGFLGKIDIVWGEKEANRTNTISGSYEQGFKVPCQSKNCAHIELTDAVPTPSRPLHGKQWISGKSQWVKGGSGVLGEIFGGQEPTGRHPFGEAFKVVLTNTIESQGKAEFSVYFRVCGSIFFGPKTCSPYIIGPFPWFSHKEKDLVFVGIDGVEAQVPENLPPVPTFSSVPPEVAQKLPPGFVDENASPTMDLSSLNGGIYDNAISDDCNSYKGVQLGALRQAIANQESRGGGDYLAVGQWVRVRENNGTINKGRALGKYQFMSYRPDVEAVFKRKSGGMKLLKRIYDNAVDEAEIKSVLLDYFPPETQEQLRVNWFKKLLNTAYSKGLRGDALIQYVGAAHYGGEGNPDSAYGSITVKEYKKELKNTKKKCQQKASSPGNSGANLSGTGKCTGTYIQPTQGKLTSGFGGRWGKMHNGIDVANAVGTPLVAIDGATVKTTYNGCPTYGNLSSRCGIRPYQGYGNIVVLKLCNGWEILYAHVKKDSLQVKPGQKVAQRQILAQMGSSGRSSGSHIHFETRTNNGTTPENPLKYIPKY